MKMSIPLQFWTNLRSLQASRRNFRIIKYKGLKWCSTGGSDDGTGIAIKCVIINQNWQIEFMVAAALAIRVPSLPSIGNNNNNNKQKLLYNNNTYDEREELSYNDNSQIRIYNNDKE